MWKSRRWRYLLNLIERLPRTSHFAEAQFLDEELAEQSGELGPREERLSEWSPLVEAVANLYDLTGSLATVLVKINGGDPSRINPYPRPVPASELVKRRRDREKHDQLVARLTPRS